MYVLIIPGPDNTNTCIGILNFYLDYSRAFQKVSIYSHFSMFTFRRISVSLGWVWEDVADVRPWRNEDVTFTTRGKRNAQNYLRSIMVPWAEAEGYIVDYKDSGPHKRNILL